MALLSAFNSKGELSDYVVNLGAVSVRPATPIGSGGGKLSPDGTRVLTTELATNKHMIVEIDSQKEVELRGLGAHEDVIGWTEEGNSLVIWNQEMPARVWTLDSANGQRRFVQTVDTLANLGTMYAKMVTNTNGTVAVYRLRRGMYTLYLADHGSSYPHCVLASTRMARLHAVPILDTVAARVDVVTNGAIDAANTPWRKTPR